MSKPFPLFREFILESISETFQQKQANPNPCAESVAINGFQTH